MKWSLLIPCLVVIIFGIQALKAQKYDYSKRYDEVSVIPEYRIYYDQALKKHQEIKQKYFLKARKAEDYLPRNFSKNGDVDYTMYLQKAIDENNILIFPNFPILISPKGIKLRSNSKIYFPVNSKLIMRPNEQPRYQALKIDGIENVEIYFPKLYGDKDYHLNEEGQWGAGMWLSNSHNILIYAPYIEKFWGDGINITSRKGGFCENITVENGLIDKNRRNGISIISGKNIKIKNMSLGNTIGHNPQSGIDIEPYNSSHILERISLENIITYNNPWNGIIVSTGDIVGEKTKNVSINIQNHVDFGSHIGLAFSFSRNKNTMDYRNVKGLINVNNVSYKNNRFFIRTYNQKKTGVKVSIKNVALDKFGVNHLIKTDLNTFLNGVYKTHKSIQ